MSRWPFRILVKYASRGRPEKFLEGLHNIYSTCAQVDFIYVLVTADIDDPTMFNDEMRDKIQSFKNCMVIYGKSDNKIHACNRDLDLIPDEWKGWDIIVNFSDDMRWTMPAWDDYIRVDFNSVSPDFSHFMAYLDPDTHGALSTLYIAGRRFLERFGFIYNPVYISLFADNEVEDIAKMIGKYHYTGYSIYQHFNPAYYPHLIRDAMFEEQQTIGWNTDSKTYYERKEKNFYLDEII